MPADQTPDSASFMGTPSFGPLAGLPHALGSAARLQGGRGAPTRFTALELSAGRSYSMFVAAHSQLVGWGAWSAVRAFVAAQPKGIPAQPDPPESGAVRRVDCGTFQLDLPDKEGGCSGTDSFDVQAKRGQTQPKKYQGGDGGFVKWGNVMRGG